MSYVALYRKWRPDTFEDVRGQEHIVTTLRNQIKYSRIGHAYLFCGTRGTGKTTLAKIMAKAANCEHPVDGSPCGECESCRQIASGQATNVVEIDAASINGVDNIRQIQNAVTYSPSGSKYLVYIIDEVHMLSAGAFNALLKTLEEPPSYVIFILATTEAHKIPATISSRCQHYDFKRIPRETISNRLEELLERECVPATREALDYIAGAADGSMRDALSILDQCIAFNLGEELNYDRVLETVGSVDIDIYMQLFKAVYDEDVKTALDVVDRIVYDGKDITQFVNEFIVFVRNLLMLKLDPELKVELTSENIARMIELGRDMDENYLIDCINTLQEAATRINAAYVKRVMLEISVIKLCKPSMQKGTGAMERRISDLEKQNENLEGRIAGALANMPEIANAPGNMQTVGTQTTGSVSGTQTGVDAVAEGAVTHGAVNQSGYTDASGRTYSPSELTAVVTENIQGKYPPAKVHELKLIAAMHRYICEHLMKPSAVYFSKAVLKPTSEEGRLDLELEDTRENRGAISYFSKLEFLQGLEENISGIMGRRIKLNYRTVPKGHMDNQLALWDVSKMNIDGVEVEFTNTHNEV
jgi:DNA polymerase-3 subunit gamma/tau